MAAEDVITLTGYVKTYDSQLGRNVGVANVLIQYQKANLELAFAVTGGDGQFTVQTSIPMSQTNDYEWMVQHLILQFGGNYYHTIPWRVTTENSTAAITMSVGANFPVGRWSLYYPYPEIIIPDTRQLGSIWRAANYFYYQQNDFPRNSPSGGTRIIANDFSGGRTNGSFGFPSCNINIYNNGHSDSNVIGTTLHELGHLTHYSNNTITFTRTHDLLRESFADYSGWSLGEKYYVSYGWKQPGGLITTTNPSPYREDVDITACADQDWRSTRAPDYGWYSPLFIDLTDDVNQHAFFRDPEYRYFLNENIANVPSSLIWEVITTSTDWTQCRQKLSQRLVPTYCTSTQLEAYLVNFDEWFDDFGHIVL